MRIDTILVKLIDRGFEECTSFDYGRDYVRAMLNAEARLPGMRYFDLFGFSSEVSRRPQVVALRSR
jgi:hypothetical protein